MASKKTLGVFFGPQSLSMVETDNQSLHKIIHFPYNVFENPAETKPLDDVRMTAIVQKSLKEEKITTKEVSLALPIKDIIFRSFTIPFMNPNEIKSVVDFEARKYIPFKLSELTFTFHSVTIQDQSTKKLRILLAAIKNETLENYCSILEHAGLQVHFIEPASVSLLRALTFKKLIAKDQTIAIIETDGKEGKILVVENGILQFVREFQMVQSAKQRMETDPEILKTRLFNEIRISIDYYIRQGGQEKIDGIISIPRQDGHDFFFGLEKDLGIPTTTATAHSILGQTVPIHPELIQAFGVTLRNSVTLSANFDLPRKAVKAAPKPVVAGVTTKKVPVNIQSLAKVFGVCVALVGVAFFLTQGMVSGMQNKIATLRQEQGVFESLSVDDIEKKTKDTKEKIEEYRGIRLQSDVTFFLTLIPQFLPDGVWLKDMSIKYSEAPAKTDEAGRPISENVAMVSKVAVDLNGYAFLENQNQQVRLVRTFLSNLKESKDFSGFFHSIDLVTAQSQLMDDYPVTVYKIECK